MNIKPTLQGLKAACLEAIEDERTALDAVVRCQKALLQAQTVLVGAKVRAREARELLRTTEQQIVRDEITSREVEIALMKGIVLQLGGTLTPEIKRAIADSPSLAKFQP